MSDRCADVLQRGRQDRVFSAAAWSTGTAESVDSAGTIGELYRDGPPATDGTWWDLASVTKPIVALAVMSLVQDGLLTLDDTVADHLADYRGTENGTLTLRQLLCHTSGLPAEVAMFHWCSTRQQMLDEIRTTALRFAPGSDVEYTSLGFVILGSIVSAVTDLPLDVVLRDRVIVPAGMPDTKYRLEPAERSTAAATEDCPWRGRLVQGTVHDENTEVLGGVAGHAGLFSTLADMQSLGQLLCRGAAGADTPVLSARTFAVMIAPATDHLRRRRSLGWQGKDATASPAGDLAGPLTFGHTGFTGTTLWVDPGSGRYAVLLTNRVHPSRHGVGMARIRRSFHNVCFGWGR